MDNDNIDNIQQRLQALRDMADSITTKNDISDSLKAFSWIVNEYDLGDKVKDLKVSEIPELVAIVENAIVDAVNSYIGHSDVEEL